MKKLIIAMAVVLVVGQVSDVASQGKGKQKGKFGQQPGQQAGQQADMAAFQYLLQHRGLISRKVMKRADGVETLTESNNKEVAAKIQEHVEAMHRRIKEGRPIHMRDPLFREIFANAGKIQMVIVKTPGGVKVLETSNDPYVAQLIQAHAEVVSLFLARGHEEVQRNHSVPPRKAP